VNIWRKRKNFGAETSPEYYNQANDKTPDGKLKNFDGISTALKKLAQAYVFEKYLIYIRISNKCRIYPGINRARAFTIANIIWAASLALKNRDFCLFALKNSILVFKHLPWQIRGRII
jgi:hypothetical protein